jgi:RNA polymerase sigma-70 factor (ECF subfamily)
MAARERLRATGFACLLAAARTGDECAIAELWRVYRPQVLRYFKVAAPRCAEDLDAETWLEVARRLASFEGDEDAFRRFLFTVARHRLIDWQRREARRPAVVLYDRLPELPAPDAATRVAAGIGLEAALSLLGGLPEPQRDAIALRVIADLSVGDVAELLGRTPGSVRVLCHRGLARLAALVEPDDLVEALA